MKTGTEATRSGPTATLSAVASSPEATPLAVSAAFASPTVVRLSRAASCGLRTISLEPVSIRNRTGAPFTSPMA